MYLQEHIIREFKDLKKTGNGPKLTVLRKLRCEIQFHITKSGLNTISDEKLIDLVKARINSQNEKAAKYLVIGRKDLAENESIEAGILQTILPPVISDEEIKESFKKIIEKAPELNDPNRLMGQLMNQYKGKNIDGSRAYSIIREILGL